MSCRLPVLAALIGSAAALLGGAVDEIDAAAAPPRPLAPSEAGLSPGTTRQFSLPLNNIFPTPQMLSKVGFG